MTGSDPAAAAKDNAPPAPYAAALGIGQADMAIALEMLRAHELIATVADCYPDDNPESRRTWLNDLRRKDSQNPDDKTHPESESSDQAMQDRQKGDDALVASRQKEVEAYCGMLKSQSVAALARQQANQAAGPLQCLPNNQSSDKPANPPVDAPALNKRIQSGLAAHVASQAFAPSSASPEEIADEDRRAAATTPYFAIQSSPALSRLFGFVVDVTFEDTAMAGFLEGRDVEQPIYLQMACGCTALGLNADTGIRTLAKYRTGHDRHFWVAGREERIYDLTTVKPVIPGTYDGVVVTGARGSVSIECRWLSAALRIELPRRSRGHRSGAAEPAIDLRRRQGYVRRAAS